MAINYGWFAKLKDRATLTSGVSSTGQTGAGWEIEGTISGNDRDKQRWLSSGASNYIRVGAPQGFVEIIQGNTAEASWVNTGIRSSKPSHLILRGGSTGTIAIVDGVDEGELGTFNKRLYVTHLNAVVGNDVHFSHAKITDIDGTVQLEIDGNYVLAAIDDGSNTEFVTRTDANADPSIAKEANFNLRMYDISGNGNHATLPSSTTWEFISSVELPSQVVAGSTGNSFKAPDGFNVDVVTIGGYSVSFSFDPESKAGTFTAPTLGDSIPDFPFFGESVQIQLIDNSSGNTAEANTQWLPPAPNSYRLLTSDPDTSNVNNAYYQWPDPPVSGNMAVFDASLYNIQSNGKLVINEDAPASFAVPEYLIDSTAMQQFTRDSGVSGVVMPSVNITTNPQTVTVGDAINLSADVSGADSVLWTANLGGTFANDAEANTTFTTSESGNLSLTLTAENAEGFRSDSVLMTVEDPQVIPGASITTAPTTANTGEQYNIEAAVTDADSVLWTCTSGQTPTFGDPSAASTTIILNEDGEHTIEITATSSTGDTASDAATITASTVVVESVLNLTVAGIGTGSRAVVLHDRNTREVVFDGSMTFNDDAGSITLTGVEVGTEIYGAYFGINPPDTGTGLFGVGETE